MYSLDTHSNFVLFFFLFSFALLMAIEVPFCSISHPVVFMPCLEVEDISLTNADQTTCMSVHIAPAEIQRYQ
jgi:hypothetical protein